MQQVESNSRAQSPLWLMRSECDRDTLIKGNIISYNYMVQDCSTSHLSNQNVQHIAGTQ